jgi:hypothetical protein
MRINPYPIKKLHPLLIHGSWFGFPPTRLSLPTSLAHLWFSLFLSDKVERVVESVQEVRLSIAYDRL